MQMLRALVDERPDVALGFLLEAPELADLRNTRDFEELVRTAQATASDSDSSDDPAD
jgi:hypothetical protein